jgi:hypothetical protein
MNVRSVGAAIAVVALSRRGRERVMRECEGCDKGFIAILHTCGTSARERFIDYLHTQEREGE